MTKSRPHPKKKEPGVSVIIPTCNRDHMLKNALLSFQNQHSAFGFEIIIADNSGVSKIEEWIKDDFNAPGCPVIYVKAADIPGPSYPRNVGAGLAVYEYLAFLDDDAVPEPGWLEVIKNFFDAHPEVAILAGKMEAQRLGHPLEFSRQYLYDRRDRRYREAGTGTAIARKYNLDIPGDYFLADYFTAANCACRGSVFRESGGFDPAIRHGQDHDLAIRCLQKGFAAAYVPEMRVRHEHGRSYVRFIKQTFSHGISTTERVIKLQKEHGYWREFSRQFGSLIKETGNFFKTLKPGIKKSHRSSCFIMVMVRLLHLAGVFCYAFKIRR